LENSYGVPKEPTKPEKESKSFGDWVNENVNPVGVFNNVKNSWNMFMNLITEQNVDSDNANINAV
jgi:hypothetical protein